MRSSLSAVGLLVSAIALPLIMIGCPLAVDDNYELSGEGEGGGPDAENGGCGEGYSCVPAIAAGEMARVEITSSVACPEGWGSAAAFSDGSDPGCPCACEKSHGGECEPGDVLEFASAACSDGDQKEDHFVSETGSCVDIYTGASGIAFGEPEATDGVCSPIEPAPAPLTMVVCKLTAPVGKSCGDNGENVCVPAIGGASAQACALVPAGGSCPSGLTSARTIYPVIKDSRACDCICGPAKGATCEGASFEVFSDGSCAAGLGAPFPAGACSDTTALDNASSVKVNAGSWTGGECPPIDLGDGSISVDMDAPLTLCCRP